MAPSKTQRWLDLLALLVGRRTPMSIDEVMEQVPAYRERWMEGGETQRASVRRMFERDKDELRRMGIPLETLRFRVEGYSEAEGYLIRKGDFYLPYLELLAGDEEGEVDEAAPLAGASGPSPRIPGSVGRVTLTEADARTAILALRQVLTLPSFPFRQDARSALGKLTFDLDPAWTGSTDPEPPRVRILDRPGGADPEGALGTLLDALYDRRRIRFRYRSIGRDAVEDREVEPWGLLFQWGSWYVAARDPTKDDDAVRLFRVDRMSKVHVARPGSAGPDFQVPGDFDVRELGGRSAWELEEDEEGPELDVLVRFLPPAGLLAVRNGWGEPVDEDASLRRFRVRRLDPFLRWILSMAGEARIVSPPAAKAGLARMAAEVRDLYR